MKKNNSQLSILNSQLKKVPELRFPEFKNSGEWEVKNISQIGETLNGLSGKKGSDFGIGKPYIQYKQVFDKSFIDFSECGKVNIKGNEKQNTVQKGDILFTTSSETPNEVGFASVVVSEPNEPTYLNSFCFILRPFDLKGLIPNFSRFLFRSSIYRKSVSAIAQGSTRFNLSKVYFLKLKIPIPTLDEQQKIAGFLSNLDEMITAHKQKLELLKQHKKGLMQKLFPQEGKKLPEWRFPEFKNDGEWVVEPLGSISRKINEKTKGRKFKLMSITAGEGLVSQIEKFGREIAGNSYKNYYVILKNDFAYNKSSTKFYPQGEIAMYEGEEIGAVPNSIFTCFRFNVEIIHPAFAKYHFINNLHGKWLLNFITVGARAHGALQVNEKDLFSLPFSYPSKQEQQKIADFFSNLDELITAEAEKIEQLEQHKEGLMQKMFPEIN